MLEWKTDRLRIDYYSKGFIPGKRRITEVVYIDAVQYIPAGSTTSSTPHSFVLYLPYFLRIAAHKDALH